MIRIIENFPLEIESMLFLYRPNIIKLPYHPLREVSKYGAFSGPYFPVFGQEKNSVFGHFSCSDH